ncbi:MAG: hypothetical protein ACFFDF_14220, partial [Candidatus Odinarchaeota archaeon]
MPYNIELNNVYDDEDPYEVYTGANFQYTQFNYTTFDWNPLVNETVTPVNNSETHLGNPNNINMINGTSDYADNMKVLDGSYTDLISTPPASTPGNKEPPDQFGDFDFTGSNEGEGISSGTLTVDDTNYATIGCTTKQGSESSTYSDPYADAYNNGWITAPLYGKINDAVRYPTTTGFSDGYITGEYDDYFYIDMTDVSIPANYYITSIQIWAYSKTDDTEYYEYMTCQYRFDGYTSWSSAIEIGQYDWSWDSATWNNLFSSHYGDSEADALQIRFDIEQNSPDSTVWYIEAAYAQIYYAPMLYDMYYTIEWNIPSDAISIEKMYYEYKTTQYIGFQLQIYNYDTPGWETLETWSTTNWISGTKTLSDAYVEDGTNNVMVHFWRIDGGSSTDMDQYIDYLYVEYISGYANCELNATMAYQFTNFNDPDLFSLNLSSFHKTNISKTIDFEIYNFNSQDWTTISSSSATSITERNFISTNPDYYFNSTGHLVLRYRGNLQLNPFELNIDYLFIRICYKMDLTHTVSFDTNGYWKYRWELIGSLQYTAWTYFEVVDPVPNFHAISESDVTTRWILQGSEISPVEDFHDDINTNYWDLVDVSNPTINFVEIPTDDAKVYDLFPNENYGSEVDLQVSYISGNQMTTFLKYKYSYLDLNYTSNSTLYYRVSGTSENPLIRVYHTFDFSESTITWSNQPASGDYQNQFIGGGALGWFEADIGAPYYYYKLVSPTDITRSMTFYSSESGSKPLIKHYFAKNYFGSGYMYMQTDTTEEIGLRSVDYGTYYSLNSGDYFQVDFQTDSDSQINLILLKDGVVNQTLILSQSGNTNFNRHIAQITVPNDIQFDQLEISSTFDDEDYCKVYDIKTYKYTLTGDYADIYVGSKRTESTYLTPDTYNLRIFEYGNEKIDTNITIGSTDYYYVYNPIQTEQCRLALFSPDNIYLPITDYHIYVNRSLNGEYSQFALLDEIFEVDLDSYVYIDVYDRFNTLIDSFTRLASDYIDLELDVYQLQIKNLMDQQTTIDINSSYVYPLLSGNTIEFMLATEYYVIGYYDSVNNYKQFTIYLDSNQAYELNRSKICFLSYTDQRGNHLFFDDYKTYINGTLLYENVFYKEIGESINITITDRYDFQVHSEIYNVVSGDNYIPITLTMYSLKVMNQQELFNHINITRDPAYYESEYYWSEWIAPGEIIKFNLFAGYYKINLTDIEGGSYSYYAYTLSGDDILLISSDNVISNVMYNIQNVNTTIGNQITNVQIDLTNQNSAINNSIINVEINLSNINSTLGNLLVNLETTISNIGNNLTSLYVFTNNSFINLNNNMNNSFIYMENNIISINQSISNLVIGVNNQLSLINGTISTLIYQVDNNLLLMNTSIMTAIFDLDTTISEIGNNITNNYILLNNSISLLDNNINDSRLAILNNLLLVNNTISNLISQVYSSIYLINNSIYTAVLDIGTSLSLVNNSISGDLSIVLQQNDFLTELYKTTMFSDLLNWTNVAGNASLIESQIDAWEFINNYRNQSIEVMLRYNNQIDTLTVSAQNTIEQFLPAEDVEYRLKSVATGEYLSDWEPLPDTKIVDFGFYEVEVPDVPLPDLVNSLTFWGKM